MHSGETEPQHGTAATFRSLTTAATAHMAPPQENPLQATASCPSAYCSSADTRKPSLRQAETEHGSEPACSDPAAACVQWEVAELRVSVEIAEERKSRAERKLKAALESSQQHAIPLSTVGESEAAAMVETLLAEKESWAAGRERLLEELGREPAPA